MFANCSLNGMQIAIGDVCLTPAVPSPLPVPYPNLAMLPTALPPTTSLKHYISNMPAHNLGTTIPMSLGDNAGVLLGVASGTVMGPGRNTVGSVKVITGGTPATKLLSPTLQNSTNIPGMTGVPSQPKVLIMS